MTDVTMAARPLMELIDEYITKAAGHLGVAPSQVAAHLAMKIIDRHEALKEIETSDASQELT